MSLQQYQEAFSFLVRVPQQNRMQTAEQLLSKYVLDSREHSALLQLAKHTELNKYGREQAEQRWEQIERHVGRIFMALDREVLKRIWFEEFEPKHAFTEVDNEGRLEFSLSFLRFLKARLAASRRVFGKALPVYFSSLVDFEIAEVELMAPICKPLVLREDSALQHGYWRLLDFTLDVADLAAKLEANIGKRSCIRTTERSNSILFVRNGARLNPRIYEIDLKFKALLKGELQNGKRKAWTKVQIENLRAVGLYSRNNFNEL